MDVQRIILIVALSIVSYMLVLQWNADYGEKPAPKAAVISQSAYSDSNGETELPQTDPEAQADLPTTGTAITKAKLVSVKTDVLNLLIDTKGGDIIQASLPAYKAALGSDLSFVLLEQTAERTYVSQSGLVGTNGPDASTDGRPIYSSEESEYILTGDSLTVDLKYTANTGVIITKRFTFTPGSYAVKQEFLVNNQSEQLFSANLFGQIKRDRSSDPAETTSMGMQSYLGPVFSTEETRYEKYSFDDMDDAQFKRRSQDGWVAMSQHYFLTAWVPAPGAEYNYQTRKLNGNYIAGFLSPAFTVQPGNEQTVSASFYVGPKLQEQMVKTQEDLKLTVDYGWLWWIASPLHSLLKWVYDLVGNWGLAIIGITILVKAALFHLNAKAFKSMAKMRKFGPEMQRLKELYGDDRQKMSQEMMKLYQKEKINPLGGCLPILAQMPIFIALYWVLLESVELRHAEFLYLADLSVKDPYFILPILMGISMFIQQMLNPTPPDPMQAKIMKMLPIVFTFFFLWFPAGLTLYWVVNNIVSIAQQYVINKQIENSTES
ncbi:membrane protein insertase YidC [Pontibacter sp. JAM-7]|uniref:membrane protein insertase YidC n=1 Tax=Pontibacter sp. JAM-7 TaxID=3366581 RepID=UPI003AF64A18